MFRKRSRWWRTWAAVSLSWRMTLNCVLMKLQSPCWMLPRSFRFWHVLSRTWSNGAMRLRIVTYDLFMIVSRTWNIACLEGCTASPGRYTNTRYSLWCGRLCDHARQVPAVFVGQWKVPLPQFLDRVVGYFRYAQRQVRTVLNCAFLDWLLTCQLLCMSRSLTTLSWRIGRFPWYHAADFWRFPSCSPLTRCSLSFLCKSSRFSGAGREKLPKSHSCTRRILAWTRSFTRPLLCATTDARMVQTPLQYV